MTSDEPLDARYFYWLYQQVAALSNKNPARSYWSLLNKLYKKPFTWFVPNDDNRAVDGLDLRYEFLELNHIEADQPWLELDCSMLEMLIGLSRRCSFDAGAEPGDWFWRMIDNLELKSYTDNHYYDRVDEIVDDILDMVNDRSYAYSGIGGLFPLKAAEKDQRNIELWYQMAAYLIENSNFE